MMSFITGEHYAEFQRGSKLKPETACIKYAITKFWTGLGSCIFMQIILKHLSECILMHPYDLVSLLEFQPPIWYC